jgi:ferredoxin
MAEESKVYKNDSAKVVIKVINEQCISAATCVVFAPNTFGLDEDGIVFAKEGTWDEAEEIIKAAKSCPTTAIIVEDLDGNQLYPQNN